MNDWFDRATTPYSKGVSLKSLYRMMVEGSVYVVNSSLKSVYQQIAAALNDLFVDLSLSPVDVQKHVEIEHVHGGLVLDSLFYWSTEDEPLWKTREGIRTVMKVLKRNSPFILLQDDARRDGFLIRLYKFFILKKTKKFVSFFDDCSYYNHFGFKTTPDFQIDHVRHGMDAALNEAHERLSTISNYVHKLEDTIAHIPRAMLITPKKLFAPEPIEVVNLMD